MKQAICESSPPVVGDRTTIEDVLAGITPPRNANDPRYMKAVNEACAWVREQPVPDELTKDDHARKLWKLQIALRKRMELFPQKGSVKDF